MNKFKIAQKIPPEFLKEKTRAVSIFLCCSVDERKASDKIVYPAERAVEEAAYHSNTVIDAVIANSTPTIIAIITASPAPTARPISVN